MPSLASRIFGHSHTSQQVHQAPSYKFLYLDLLEDMLLQHQLDEVQGPERQ